MTVQSRFYPSDPPSYLLCLRVLPRIKCHDNDGDGDEDVVDEAVDVDERSFSYPGSPVQSFSSCNSGGSSEWEQELDVIKVSEGIKISFWS